MIDFILALLDFFSLDPQNPKPTTQKPGSGGNPKPGSTSSTID
jgi:hypothetical protein